MFLHIVYLLCLFICLKGKKTPGCEISQADADFAFAHITVPQYSSKELFKFEAKRAWSIIRAYQLVIAETLRRTAGLIPQQLCLHRRCCFLEQAELGEKGILSGPSMICGSSS